MKYLLFYTFTFATIHHVNKRFENTNWVSRVSNKYVSSINLRGNNYAVRYNKNTSQTFRGSYSVSGDTLIIKERDDSKQIAAYHRLKFILKGHELHLYSLEEMTDHQWVKDKFAPDANTVFTEI
ncbi:hypothetical protein [Mucilaginibacter sp.]|uniref:hypothetical protein n=1 Tax=Mucilaginibacter sp. TaxID=1882438 RepID=UPI003B008398